jgi:hypothetical protein
MTLAAPAGVLFIRTVPEAEGDHRTAQASAGELSLHVEHPPFGLRLAHSDMTTVRAGCLAKRHFPECGTCDCLPSSIMGFYRRRKST